MDAFVTGMGVDFLHYRATPSPIGKKDRGDYRRNDGVDIITSNGMIYKCAGKFTATMTDNSHQQRRSDGGLLESSESRLVMPRFYNKDALADGERIYLCPGDRVYIADPHADVMVANYQQMDYEPGIDNEPMFPIVKMEQSIIDSQGAEYIENKDFIVTTFGNIRWLPSGSSPGIDPDTGKGRIYSVRYLYKAFWYIISLPKEIRVTNVTTGNIRAPERMPYYAIIEREYLYHNKNRSTQTSELPPNEQARSQKAPIEPVEIDNPTIPVDMSNIDSSEE
jgi:hypothetical protein